VPCQPRLRLPSDGMAMLHGLMSHLQPSAAASRVHACLLSCSVLQGSVSLPKFGSFCKHRNAFAVVGMLGSAVRPSSPTVPFALTAVYATGVMK